MGNGITKLLQPVLAHLPPTQKTLPAHILWSRHLEVVYRFIKLHELHSLRQPGLCNGEAEQVPLCRHRRGVDADGGVRSLVSLEALQASERAREALEDEAGKLHAQLVQQRLKQSNVRFTFVGYFARLREESLLQSAFSSWRAVVSQAKVSRHSRPGSGCVWM